MNFEWVLVAVCYLLGSFPTALLVGRMVGHDPTAEGSGNPGATNMFRIAGFGAGSTTLFFDIAKALAAALIGRAVGGAELAAWCGTAAVVGHIFPLLRQSRGGKGVACFGGLTIGAWPLVAPVGMLLWIATAKLSGHSFAGALVAVPAVAIGTMVTGRTTTEIVLAWLLTALIIGRHHTNISGFIANRRSSAAS